ncbi:cupin domain-containing protein [Actinophytocola sp.]|uniref:cupin domain-containing protein n=1 Tax=Actinophytocola sp. TaxID=1872138 RepID=UPI002ECFD3D5
MSDLQSKNLHSPDEVRPFRDHGHADLVNLDSGPVGLGTFEPGWRWSNDVKPIAGTNSCEVNHIGYVVSGRMRIVMDDGQESEVGPGDAFHIPPGHDAWTLGDESCVLLDFGGLKGYAQPSS